jgi:4-alpha-glucanotransferase
MDAFGEGAEYKFLLIDSRLQKVVEFESGANHAVSPTFDNAPTMLCQHYPTFTTHVWKGAGINIQLSSLRSATSWGVGDLGDLKSCIDWASSIGFKLIQLLPINDTTAFQDERDSYPYAAISAFALHPIVLDLHAMANYHQLVITDAWKEKSNKLNQLTALDYTEVIKLKLQIARALFEQTDLQFLKDSSYQAFFRKNRHWLVPFAAFSVCRDQYGTADHQLWPSPYREAEPAAIKKITSAKHVSYAHVAFYYFLQFHLHLQLLDAVTHAHASGIVLKGDLPIGVGRYSVETWMNPTYFHLDEQAGAPPDAFSKQGQNWQFPTYNWESMQADGYAWWKKRFAHMAQYMDAIRIDHVLGFFRIWSIPQHAVDGRFGRFVPAISIAEIELTSLGLDASLQRLCKPYWTQAIWDERFGKHASWLAEQLLENASFKPAFQTQRAIQQWLIDFPERNACEQGLLDLLTEVILWEDEHSPGHYHFRIDMMETDSYLALDPNDRNILKQAYFDYFFQRQNAIWLDSAQEKLRAICRATDMLICAEDLGMVPEMVGSTLHAMEILTLQVQRMPTQPNQRFANPTNAPYLSVVMPSTHDMSPLRSWWQEKTTNQKLFLHDQLNIEHDTPPTMQPALSNKIYTQHLQSSAMWSIFLLQDVLALHPGTAHPNPDAERINDPGNPNHIWNYRCHIAIESLQQHEPLNQLLRSLLQQTQRTFPCH